MAPDEGLSQTEMEKLSPGSGYNRTIKEYATTPLEDKLELLRNALLNGLYGDYTIELREDLYQIAAAIQPLDVKIIKYLVSICPDQEYYHSLYESSKVEKQELETQLAQDAMRQAKEEAEAKYKEIDARLTLQSIKEEFPMYPDEVIQRAQDRLQALGLAYNNGANRWGKYSPYFGFIPLRMAKTFLAFIEDPRNCKDKQNS